MVFEKLVDIVPVADSTSLRACKVACTTYLPFLTSKQLIVSSSNENPDLSASTVFILPSFVFRIYVPEIYLSYCSLI